MRRIQALGRLSIDLSAKMLLNVWPTRSSSSFRLLTEAVMEGIWIDRVTSAMVVQPLLPGVRRRTRHDGRVPQRVFGADWRYHLVVCLRTFWQSGSRSAVAPSEHKYLVWIEGSLLLMLSSGVFSKEEYASSTDSWQIPWTLLCNFPQFSLGDASNLFPSISHLQQSCEDPFAVTRFSECLGLHGLTRPMS